MAASKRGWGGPQGDALTACRRGHPATSPSDSPFLVFRVGRALDYLARALSLLPSATPRSHALEGVDVADIELNTSASLSQLGERAASPCLRESWLCNALTTRRVRLFTLFRFTSGCSMQHHHHMTIIISSLLAASLLPRRHHGPDGHAQGAMRRLWSTLRPPSTSSTSECEAEPAGTRR